MKGMSLGASQAAATNTKLSKKLKKQKLYLANSGSRLLGTMIEEKQDSLGIMFSCAIRASTFWIVSIRVGGLIYKTLKLFEFGF
jgi:hypothetical protein